MITDNILYIFLDEGGNLDFSINGTKYFVLTALSKQRPFEAYKGLNELKYDLIEKGVEIEYFHASENKQDVRDMVFQIIDRHLDETRIDGLIALKQNLPDEVKDEERLYPWALGKLLGHVLEGYDVKRFEKIIVFTDSIPVTRKRKAIEKAIKKSLSINLSEGIQYYIVHHSSKFNYDLQIVDYCNWAIYRKQNGDERSYDIIKRVIKGEWTV